MDDCIGSAVEHDGHSADYDNYVYNLFLRSLRDSSIMEESRQYECDWRACQWASDRKESIKLVVNEEGYNAWRAYDDGSTKILRHLSRASLWPAFEEPILDDNVGRVNDQGVREDQIETEHNFD